MPTIFVRERRKVEAGEKKPRYRVVGVHDPISRSTSNISAKRNSISSSRPPGANVVDPQGRERGKGKAVGKGRRTVRLVHSLMGEALSRRSRAAGHSSL